jgi:hypothetical protein
MVRLTRLKRAAVGGLAVLAAAVSGCTWESDCHGTGWGTIGSGVLVTESSSLAAFDAVSVSGAVWVEVRQGDTDSVSITAEDNILPMLSAEVQGGRLVLGPRPDAQLSPTELVVFRVICRCSDLREIVASGASQVIVEGIDSEQLEVALSGASIASASGSAIHQVIGLSGASRFDGADLPGRIARVRASNASQAVVRIGEQLEASASGSSIIEYLGNPTVIANVSGGSAVVRIGD